MTRHKRRARRRDAGTRKKKWPEGIERDLAFQMELAEWERKVSDWEAGLRKTRPRRPVRN